MPHLDALLPLYPDTASRRTLLAQALAHIRDDLSALRQALDASDYATARQQAHRAKGTISFLAHDADAPRLFDALSDALRAQDSAGIHLARTPVETALLELEAVIRQRLEQLDGLP